MTDQQYPEFNHSHVERLTGVLNVRDFAGAGPAFVLMHGFPDNLHIYDALIPRLVRAGRRVVAFDFLGFGESDKPGPESYSFDQQVGDLEVVVDALELDQVVPVAHDSSGSAAVNYALRHPDRVAALCLLNCFYSSSPSLRFPELIELFATGSLAALTRAVAAEPSMFGWVLNFQRRQFQEHLPEDQKQFYAEFLGPLIDDNFRRQPSSGPAFVRMTSLLAEEVAKNTSRTASLGRMNVPTQIIWGQTDPYLNTGVAQHLRSLIPASQLHLLEAGHWVQLDLPDQVAQLMLSAPIAMS